MDLTLASVRYTSKAVVVTSMTSIMERGMTDKEVPPAQLPDGDAASNTNAKRKVLARELDWFSVEFNRASKRPRDLLNEAKQQFTDGKFESSST